MSTSMLENNCPVCNSNFIAVDELLKAVGPDIKLTMVERHIQINPDVDPNTGVVKEVWIASIENDFYHESDTPFNAVAGIVQMLISQRPAIEDVEKL